MTLTTGPAVLPGIRSNLHPPRYRMHKYWARKPSNVVRAYIDAFAPPGGLVFDPFSGSGVTVIEAVLSGRRAVGADINPIANLMCRVTLQGVTQDELNAVDAWVSRASTELDRRLYAAMCDSCHGAAEVRMLVWGRRAKCGICGSVHVLPQLEKVGRAYVCSSCGAMIRATQRNGMDDEQVLETWLSCDRCGDRQLPGLAEGVDPVPPAPTLPSMKVIRNDRILATDGMGFDEFLGPRGVVALATALEGIEALDDRPRDLARVILSGAIAQATRLLPYRGRLSSGGPAWSVPGFWFPAHRVEPNFGRALWARLARAKAALKDVRFQLGRFADVSELGDDVAAVDAVLLTMDSKSLPIATASVDYVFTDPPYGGSVPYLEFSVLWNAVIGSTPDYEGEIVISDAQNRLKTADRYGRELGQSLAETHRILKPGSLMHLTFQHLDDAIWSILHGAAAGAGFRFVGEIHQPPSVRSSKSQLAPGNSPYGDMILAFERT